MANDSDNIEPVLRNTRHQRFDQAGQKFVRQTEKLEKRAQARRSQEKKDKKQPPGGFDDTPVPWAEPGYTLKFTLHRAHNLPFADINTLSSDPYVIATLYTALTKRHKDDPDLNFRTPTVHRNTNPTWNAEWIVANVPASGFYLKCRIYDEDPADHDDRLGNVHVDVSNITETWSGINEQTFDVKKRMGSKRAYLVRGCAFLFVQNVKMHGEMVISVENLGRTPDESGGRAYTIGPLFWYRHFSPLIGRLTGTKDTDDETDQDGKKKTQKYKSVIFPVHIPTRCKTMLNFCPAFKPSKCSFLDLFQPSSIIATSSSSLLSLACSHRTLFAAASSTALCITNTREYTIMIARRSGASSPNPTSK